MSRRRAARPERRRARGAPLLAALLVMTGPHAAPGGISQETVPGTALRYTLSLPAGAPPASAAPLVVSLHYGGPVGPWYGRGLLEGVVEPALRPLGAVMVAPDCPERTWLECRDAVDRVIAHVRESRGLSTGCTVLTGYSKGGIGTWDLAARTPQRFSAAVVMAARAPDAALTQAWSLPVRVLHGARDELFPVADVRAAVARLREAGVDAGLEVLDGVTHYDTHRFAAPLAGLAGWVRGRCDAP